MADFKMGSSRVGADGGVALARGLRAGEYEFYSWQEIQDVIAALKGRQWT